MHFVKTEGRWMETEIGRLYCKRPVCIREYLRVGWQRFEYLYKENGGVWLDYSVFVEAVAYATKKPTEDVINHLFNLRRMDSQY